MPQQKSILNIYNKAAESFQDRFMSMDLYNDSYDRFCGLIEKADAEILEIACGPGNITRYIIEKRPDFNVLGIDFAEKMIDLARKNAPLAEFNVMDCREIDKLNRKFDGIMCGFCLPYLKEEECIKFINDAYKLLRTDGVIYISAMEGERDQSGFENTSFSGYDQLYIHYYPAKFIMEELSKAGFHDIELIRQHYPETDGTFSIDIILTAKKV